MTRGAGRNLADVQGRRGQNLIGMVIPARWPLGSPADVIRQDHLEEGRGGGRKGRAKVYDEHDSFFLQPRKARSAWGQRPHCAA